MTKPEIPINRPPLRIPGIVSPLNFPTIYAKTNGNQYALLTKHNILVYVSPTSIYMEPVGNGLELEADVLVDDMERRLVLFDLQTEYTPTDRRHGERRAGFPSGSDFMRNAIKWFKRFGLVDGIQFSWSPGSINYDKIIQAVSAGNTRLEDAAWDTWTGQTIKDLEPEYSEVTIKPVVTDGVLHFEGSFSLPSL